MYAKVNSRVTIYQGTTFKVLSENITLANGVMSNMDLIRHPGASAVIPLSDNDNVIMIRQYRHAIGEYFWEIPAGTFDLDETAIECAQRELLEETGYWAETWQKLGEIVPVPGYSDERIHIFLATGLALAEQNLDEDEMLEVHEIRFADALKMIYNGIIQDGKTISGLYMAHHRLK